MSPLFIYKLKKYLVTVNIISLFVLPVLVFTLKKYLTEKFISESREGQ